MADNKADNMAGSTAGIDKLAHSKELVLLAADIVQHIELGLNF